MSISKSRLKLVGFVPGTRQDAETVLLVHAKQGDAKARSQMRPDELVRRFEDESLSLCPAAVCTSEILALAKAAEEYW